MHKVTKLREWFSVKWYRCLCLSLLFWLPDSLPIFLRICLCMVSNMFTFLPHYILHCLSVTLPAWDVIFPPCLALSSYTCLPVSLSCFPSCLTTCLFLPSCLSVCMCPYLPAPVTFQYTYLFKKLTLVQVFTLQAPRQIITLFLWRGIYVVEKHNTWRGVSLVILLLCDWVQLSGGGLIGWRARWTIQHTHQHYWLIMRFVIRSVCVVCGWYGSFEAHESVNVWSLINACVWSLVVCMVTGCLWYILKCVVHVSRWFSFCGYFFSPLCTWLSSHAPPYLFKLKGWEWWWLA